MNGFSQRKALILRKPELIYRQPEENPRFRRDALASGGTGMG
jgi:hypothetical protein